MKMRKWWRWVALFGVALCVFCTAASAGAESRTWDGAVGNWSNESGWDTGVPASGDNAMIINGATVNLDVTTPTLSGLGIYSSTLSHPGPYTLTLGGGSSLSVDGGGVYNLSGTELLTGTLIKTSGEVKIGIWEQGYFNQSDNSSFHFSGALYLGDQATGFGRYTMTGGEMIAGPSGAGGIVLGEWGGRGEFLQSGGSVTINDLTLARQQNSSGYYELSGEGSTLNVNADVIVGRVSEGVFLQSGGTHLVNGSLILGDWEAGVYGNGTYTLEGGTLSAANLYIGSSGTGTFNQSGGVNYVGFYPDGSPMEVFSELIVARFEGSTGTYNLTGGVLNAAREIVGDAGYGMPSVGIFNQSGKSQNLIHQDLIIGQDPMSEGTFTLSENAQLDVMGNIYLGDEGGTGTFIQTGNSTLMAENRLVIGTRSETGSEGDGASTGTFIQGVEGGEPGDAPTVNAAELVLGEHSGTQGTYELNSGTLHVSNNVYVGYDGVGIFNQTGGLHLLDGELVIGYRDSSGTGDNFGEYNISGGQLYAGQIVVGGKDGNDDQPGYGTFNQVGGYVETISLFLADTPGSVGICNLEGGDLRVGSQFGVIGARGEGAFNQTGGTHAAGGLYVGWAESGSGTYNLDSGTLTVLGDTIVGAGGTGTFNQGKDVVSEGDGGTFTTQNLFVGNNTFGNSQYNLGKGNIAVIDNAFIGYSGTGAFVQDGGSFTVGGILSIGDQEGSSGTYELNNGSLYSFYTAVGREGNGAFTQAGGSFTSDNILAIGEGGIGNGTYTLIGGSLNIHRVDVGHYGTGVLTQTGGSAQLDYLNIGRYEGAQGTYNLAADAFGNSGTLKVANNLNVGLEGTGTFNQSGGQLMLYGNLVIGENVGSSGTYNLNGGSLTAANIVNNDRFNYSGGDLNANIQNNATGTVALSKGAGGVRVVNGTVSNAGLFQIGEPAVPGTAASFTADVNNTGTFKVSNATVTFSGTFINGGAYISDPSTSYFQALEIGKSGYMQGGPGDRFYVETNFFNASTQNALWQTGEALLGFTGSDAHIFSIAGADLGANLAGYASNFAWGTLTIEGSLSLTDGNETLGGAQYVRALLGVDIEDGLVTNIFGEEGLTIYYLASLSENAYLGGLTYDLEGGGRLAPATVPIPSAVLLLGSGLVGLIALRRKAHEV